MFDFFCRNRRLLVLTIALITVAGISAYHSLPRLEDPELTGRDALVTTRFPGADAERVEALVTEKIEEELFDVEQIKTLESTSRAGISILQVELQDEVVDVDEVWSRIRDKLNDVDRLAELGDEARAILSGVPDVVHTDADLTETLPKLSVAVDEEEARLAGLDHTSIARQLDTTLEGAVGGSLLEATEELPIRVRLAESRRGDLVQIASLDLLPTTGATPGQRKLIPISALGKINLVPERALIGRRNGRRVNVVRGYITAGVLPSKVLADYRDRLATELDLSAGYDMEFGGEFAERNEAVGNLSASLGILVVVMA